MILEVAMLNVRSSMESEFEVAFTKASAIIASMRGYISRQHPCLKARGLSASSLVD